METNKVVVYCNIEHDIPIGECAFCVRDAAVKRAEAAEREVTRVTDLHKGLMAEADKRVEAAERRLSASEKAREDDERYKAAWNEWRSLQTGDVQKLFDAAIRCTAAERRVAELEKGEGKS